MIVLEVVSATSIQVSWDRLDIPEITRYIVYYSQSGNSESATTVPSSMNSVTIENLLTDVEYQFHVVAVAELDGDVVMGERSNISIAHPTPPPPTTPPTAVSSARPTPPPATTHSTNETQGMLPYILIILLQPHCYCIGDVAPIVGGVVVFIIAAIVVVILMVVLLYIR